MEGISQNLGIWLILGFNRPVSVKRSLSTEVNLRNVPDHSYCPKTGRIEPDLCDRLVPKPNQSIDPVHFLTRVQFPA